MYNICEPPLEPCDFYDPMEDWVHVDELEKYDDAKDKIEEIIHQVYNIGNVQLLEEAIDELASIFELKLPTTQPKLVNKEKHMYESIVQMSHHLASLNL